MKHWQGWSQLLGWTGAQKPGVNQGQEQVLVHMHYKSSLGVDAIDDFRVSGGLNFFLTFLEGGTVDVNLMHVRQIVFEEIAGYFAAGRPLADIPNYKVKVVLRNGRTLEGHSVGLYSFSGKKDGIDWMHSFQGRTPDRVEAQQNLARIVIRDTHGRA